MRVTHSGRTVEVQNGETVLDALLRSGENIPYSCKAGSCQSCRMRVVSGSVPEAAQVGLKETLRAQGYFLACSCRPDGDIEIESDIQVQSVVGVVRARDRVGEDVLRIRLEIDDELDYAAGQFVSLVRSDGLARAYSLASIPGDPSLELHVRRMPGGRMSGWIHESLGVGDAVSLRGPFGSCFYVPGRPDQRLILAGVGTGLAPLLGIARDALARGHEGPVDLFHGALVSGRLYGVDVLRNLERCHRPFRYHACALNESQGDPETLRVGAISDIVLSSVKETLATSRVFLCGDPGFVNDLRKRLFLAGASMQEIHADPFTPTGSTTDAN